MMNRMWKCMSVAALFCFFTLNTPLFFFFSFFSLPNDIPSVSKGAPATPTRFPTRDT